MSTDVVTRFAGRGVVDRDDVIRLSKKLTAGTAVKLTVKRGDSTQFIAVDPEG